MLSRAEARSLTDEVKNDAERLWRKLVELYEGGAHLTLGYTSWGAYFKAEFNGSQRHAYRLLDAGRVANTLASDPRVTEIPSERQARELAPLKNDPVALKEVWSEVVELHPEPTAADVRAVVEARPDFKQGTLRQQQIADANKKRVYTALSGIDGYCLGLAGMRLDQAVRNATPDDLAAWEELTSKAITELNRLRRVLKEGVL